MASAIGVLHAGGLAAAPGPAAPPADLAAMIVALMDQPPGDNDMGLFRAMLVANGCGAPLRRRALLHVAREAERLAGLEPRGPDNQDAELIALCNRLTVLEESCEAIYLAIRDDDDDAAEAAIEPLRDEIVAICDRLYGLGTPSTLESQRAVARAALASADRDRDGAILVGSGGIAARLAFGLAHSVAGSA
jgi:hypothetical protein